MRVRFPPSALTVSYTYKRLALSISTAFRDAGYVLRTQTGPEPNHRPSLSQALGERPSGSRHHKPEAGGRSQARL